MGTSLTPCLRSFKLGLKTTILKKHVATTEIKTNKGEKSLTSWGLFWLVLRDWGGEGEGRGDTNLMKHQFEAALSKCCS